MNEISKEYFGSRVLWAIVSFHYLYEETYFLLKKKKEWNEETLNSKYNYNQGEGNNKKDLNGNMKVGWMIQKGLPAPNEERDPIKTTIQRSSIRCTP